MPGILLPDKAIESTSPILEDRMRQITETQLAESELLTIGRIERIGQSASGLYIWKNLGHFLRQMPDITNRPNRYLVIHWVTMLARINDPQMI
jgi:hypothetical protein